MEVSRLSQPLAVNTSEQNLSPSPSQSADSTEWCLSRTLEQEPAFKHLMSASGTVNSSCAAGQACAWDVEKWSPKQPPQTTSASKCHPAIRDLHPGRASRQERTSLAGLCTHLSDLLSQQDHKGPFILRYEICVVSLLCFNETLFILGF